MGAGVPRVIKVQKQEEELDERRPEEKRDELLAKLCYYFPQYTFNQAKRLPFKRVILLLSVARRIEATRMGNLVQIAAAPHTKKLEGFEILQKYFAEQAAR